MKEKVECYEFYVDGMHCAACELLIEKKLSKVKGVDKVDAILDKNKVKVYGTLDEDLDELAEEFTELVKKDGYTIHSKNELEKKNNLRDFIFAVPIALILILVFIILQLTGIINLVSVSGEFNLGSALILGLIASVSSCMAVVGGLSLSISASYAKSSNSSKYKPQIYFHLGRIIGFFILGFGVGLLGLEFRNYLETSNIPNLLMLLAGIIMLILGINLLDVFYFSKRLQIKMPKFISKSLLKSEEIKNEFTPALLGVITFFLPCGFTQAAQIQALSSGSPLRGGLYMLTFALGTLPALGMISFASVNLSHTKLFRSGIFYKTAGILVIAFALLNIYGYFVFQGWVRPIFNF